MIRLLAILALLAIAFCGPAAASTYTVNSSADTSDVTPGDDVCETAAANGICTLRAAQQEASAHEGADTIVPDPEFAPYQVELNGSLPDLLEPDTINGLGEGACGTDFGFSIEGSPSIDTAIAVFGAVTIKGMKIVGTFANPSTGISVTGTGAMVQCNILDLDVNVGIKVTEATDATVIGNTVNGVSDSDCFQNNASTNTLFEDNLADDCEDGFYFSASTGGTLLNNRAVGQLHNGFHIDNSDGATLKGNKTTSADGLSAPPVQNAFDCLRIADSDGTIVGGPLVSDRNIFSACDGYGIWVRNGSTNTHLENNYLGPDASGDSTLCNGSGALEDRGSGTVNIDNLPCASAPGCCGFDGENMFGATCIDQALASTFEMVLTSQGDCDGIESGLSGGDSAVYVADGFCTGGTAPNGICAGGGPTNTPAPATSTPTPTVTRTPTRTPDRTTKAIASRYGSGGSYGRQLSCPTPATCEHGPLAAVRGERSTAHFDLSGGTVSCALQCKAFNVADVEWTTLHTFTSTDSYDFVRNCEATRLWCEDCDGCVYGGALRGGE